MKKFLNKLARYDNLGVLVALIIIIIIGLIFAPKMFSVKVIMRLLKTNMIYGIVAVGVMFVLVTGSIDLSTAAIMSLACNVIGKLQVLYPKEQIPVVGLMAVGMLIGLVCGLFNGFLVGKLKIHPMLATMGSQYIFLALSYHFEYVNIVSNLMYKSVRNFSSDKIFGIYRGVWILILLYIIVGLILKYTKAGRKMYAIGSNKESAAIAGFSAVKVQMIAYGLCGICCGFAGFMFVSNFAYSYFDVSGDYALKAICIAVLGGVSPAGGRGRIDGMAISIIVISLISYFTTMIPGFGLFADTIYASLVILALFLNFITVKTTKARELARKDQLLR